MKLTLGQVADWIHAEGDFDEAASAQGYSIDSRTLSAGDLFFAVKGERVDGHDFVESALSGGAVAAVVSMRWLKPPDLDESKLLRVPDDETDCVLQSMQQVARQVRRIWNRAGDKRVIGVTGSAGKTTTKECIAQALSTRYRVLKTEGNFNNGFGLPLQLLKLEPEHEIAVLELGMNHAGEIRDLAKIAEPDWGVVSNVAAVHQEFFSDGLEGIARAKYELIEALPPEGIAFLNGDDDRVAAFARNMGARSVLYGTRESLAVRAVEIEEFGFAGTSFMVVSSGWEQRVSLRLPGQHNVLNALAAIAVAVRSGVQPAACIAALEEMRPTEKRGNIVKWNGARLVNDTYNSNPRALGSMVDALRNTAASRRIVVAGEMLELGGEGAALHFESGRAMAGMDFVLGVRGLAGEIVRGAAGQGVAAQFVATPEAAGDWMRSHLQPGDVVLLKASRGVRLERALDVLSGSSGRAPVSRDVA